MPDARLTITEALQQIILCREPLRKVTNLATVIVQAKGTANELAGTHFALWPLWAAEEAEYLIIGAMLVHLKTEETWFPFAEGLEVADVEKLIAKFQRLQKSIRERNN